MNSKQLTSETSAGKQPTAVLRASQCIPAGAPTWVTPELINDTISTWQSVYQRSLTLEDALEILLSVGHLLDRLTDEELSDDETISGPCQSVLSRTRA